LNLRKNPKQKRPKEQDAALTQTDLLSADPFESTPPFVAEPFSVFLQTLPINEFKIKETLAKPQDG